MRAIVHAGSSGLEGLKYQKAADRTPGPGEVKVNLRAAGINHRDLFLMAARTNQDAPLILGSDGAGVIEAVGTGVVDLPIGAKVVINPCIGWDTLQPVPDVPQIVGGPTDGTLAEAILIPAKNAYPKPEYLTWEEAGVLPLAALTAYRALFTRGRLQPGEHVLIPGIGGGVATFALLMAVAAGARVSVTSRSEVKQQRALALGARQAVDSHSNWNESLHGEPVDLILDSIGPSTLGQSLEVIKPGGRIVMFGASSGDRLEFPARSLFFPQASLIGTSMGSSEEFGEMLKYIELHQIRPVLDRVFAVQDTASAFRRMQQGEQFGNIGIRI
ncbi:putative zinc-type alcohol dehydrogenase-like protein YogA [Paenibacillus albidus]|uniref:Zinc-type alcohol dehydrogenase-like protein YogA n=1 Tax=Paenibacillus albidus TaxID=2041023 RepID=A0A917BXC4_9BACL|nr:NAD(P)-dependent alcohol dehydrogenase [Paenibacillus albidus]GGF60267.1 putative zinc-type alcohol dehydrogenase-like protein YogA [Paenibacillus albidus]